MHALFRRELELKRMKKEEHKLFGFVLFFSILLSLVSPSLSILWTISRDSLLLQLQNSDILTEPFAMFGPKNPPIAKFWVVQKHRSNGFKILKCYNVLSRYSVRKSLLLLLIWQTNFPDANKQRGFFIASCVCSKTWINTNKWKRNLHLELTQTARQSDSQNKHWKVITCTHRKDAKSKADLLLGRER